MHYATERKGSLPARFTESWEIEKDSMQACYQKSDVGCDRANKNSVLVLSSLCCHIDVDNENGNANYSWNNSVSESRTL